MKNSKSSKLFHIGPILRWMGVFGLPHLLIACTSMMERSADSGYGRNQGSGWRNLASTPSTSLMNNADHEATSQRTQSLSQLENRVSSRRELEQYSRALPWFDNEDERKEFLALPGLEARQNWLQSKNFYQRPVEKEKEFSELIENQDIAIGMPEAFVSRSWGEPSTIEVSGHPLFKNQRWKYEKMSSSPNGFRKERKTVFIEAGKVTGWDTE